FASSSVFFFLSATAPTALYTLSLHDALPIFTATEATHPGALDFVLMGYCHCLFHCRCLCLVFRYHIVSSCFCCNSGINNSDASRSEEHTSELQSRENLVCRLLLEKKK